MMNWFSHKKQDYLKKDVASMAAIYAHDGTLWAKSPKWPGLKEYNVQVEDMSGAMVDVAVNETQVLKVVANGSRSCGDGGVRICGQKYTVVKIDPETKSATLVSPGGGGVIFKTRQAILVALFDGS